MRHSLSERLGSLAYDAPARARMRQPLRMLVASLPLLASPLAFADIFHNWGSTEWRYAVHGLSDFDQRREAVGEIPGLGYYGRYHCAPTASADVLTYLASHTIGGIPEIPNETWLDYDFAEYVTSTNLIATCGEVMETNTVGLGTTLEMCNAALVRYLSPDRFSVSTLGGTTGPVSGLPFGVVASALCSPLYSRATAIAGVAWMSKDIFSEWEWRGGHCYAISGLRWNTASGTGELTISDPDDSWRIEPGEPMTEQSPFAEVSYPIANDSFEMQWGGTLQGGVMEGYHSSGAPALMIYLSVVQPTSVFTLDWSGSDRIVSIRPTRMEADVALPLEEIAPPLPHPGTRLALDFVTQRIFVVEGVGPNALVRSTDGRGGAASVLPTIVAPVLIASGRFGELAVFGLQGGAPTLEVVTTAGSSRSTLRALPGLPDACAYDDVKDQILALAAGPSLLAAIPRDPTQQMTTYAIPASIFLSGTVSVAAEPESGAVWMCSTGTNGKMYRLVLGSDGVISSMSTAVHPTIVAPRDPIALSADVIAFGSGAELRVIRRNTSTGQWDAAMDSPLWGVPIGSAFDISRARNNFKHNDPIWDLAIDTTPDSAATPTPACVADLTLDDKVDGADLAMLLGNWVQDGFGDLDQSDVIDAADLAIMLAQWGTCQ